MIKKILPAFFITLLSFVSVSPVAAQRTVNINASDAAAHANVFITPQTATFIEGSTFEVPIYVNTQGHSINAVDLHVVFDANKLSIVQPSGGKSIIGLWVQPPSYDNTKGTAKISGTIPGGITTDSGLLVTITFQAKASGEATIGFSNETVVLMNDGLGSAAILGTNRAKYTIVPKPPAGVTVYSETHPFQDHWYNNNNPVLTWDEEPGTTGFSYLLDNEPNTVPDNTITASDTVKSFENLNDGIWYFHIKALKQKIWGNTTTFVIKIDTGKPAEFTPTTDYVSAAVINRFLISFFTTDSLSGVDHFEVGVIDKAQSITESPVFVQTDSPYQLPLNNSKNLQVIVRAFDKAGNVREESISVSAPFLPLKWLTDHAVIVLLIALALILLLIIFHYLIGHRIIRRLRRAFQYFESTDGEETHKNVRDVEYIPEQRIPVQQPRYIPPTAPETEALLQTPPPVPQQIPEHEVVRETIHLPVQFPSDNNQNTPSH